MKRMAMSRALAVSLAFGAIVLVASTAAAEPPRQPATAAHTVVRAEPVQLLRQLAGTWEVRQRMWPAPGSGPVSLPAAKAQRRLVHDGYVEEEMTPTDGEQFTRRAVFAYNDVKQAYEYFSIDSRLPQMMAYPTGEERPGGVIEFRLSEPFVAPTWADDADVPFTGRAEFRPGEDRQVFRLYLKRMSAQPTEEFLAFEYIYSRAD